MPPCEKYIQVIRNRSMRSPIKLNNSRFLLLNTRVPAPGVREGLRAVIFRLMGSHSSGGKFKTPSSGGLSSKLDFRVSLAGVPFLSFFPHATQSSSSSDMSKLALVNPPCEAPFLTSNMTKKFNTKITCTPACRRCYLCVCPLTRSCVFTWHRRVYAWVSRPATNHAQVGNSWLYFRTNKTSRRSTASYAHHLRYESLGTGDSSLRDRCTLGSRIGKAFDLILCPLLFLSHGCNIFSKNLLGI